jgi:diaminohydroxyphosphoribosylaminopyrimidine deaminase / 5-amino-6-(5-phosphoribosylamino)uracil reductase
MALALDLAAAAGPVSPNPAVGCVIVSDGRAVGQGFTRPPGGPHAEVVALAEAGDGARGAEVFVTLEPCSHHGRTPPCADALIAAGVAAVHCALPDPDANVSGRGIAHLRAAGIRVTAGDGAEAAARGLTAFLTHRLTGRPLVTAKFAASLDGRIATRTGDARWISSSEARNRTRAERSRYDAILAGIGTVIADDPQLTARLPNGSLAPRQPLRIVLDSRGRLPSSARVLEPVAPTLIATTERSGPDWRAAIKRAGARVLLLPAAGDAVSLPALLDALGKLDVLSLLVEGGSAVHGAFFDAGLVDRVQAILAPLVIGGAEAPAAVAGHGPALLREAHPLLDLEVTRLGPDIIVTGSLRPPPRLALTDDGRVVRA